MIVVQTRRNFVNTKLCFRSFLGLLKIRNSMKDSRMEQRNDFTARESDKLETSHPLH